MSDKYSRWNPFRPDDNPLWAAETDRNRRIEQGAAMTTHMLSAAELAAQPDLFERQRRGEVRITDYSGHQVCSIEKVSRVPRRPYLVTDVTQGERKKQ